MKVRVGGRCAQGERGSCDETGSVALVTLRYVEVGLPGPDLLNCLRRRKYTTPDSKSDLEIL